MTLVTSIESRSLDIASRQIFQFVAHSECTNTCHSHSCVYFIFSMICFLLVGVETHGGFFFFSQALHFLLVVVSGASGAFVVVIFVVVVGFEVDASVFGKVIALLVVSAGFGVLAGAGVEGFGAIFMVFLSPFGPY